MLAVWQATSASAADVADQAASFARARTASASVVDVRWTETRTVPKDAASKLVVGILPAGSKPGEANLDYRMDVHLVLDSTGRAIVEQRGTLPTVSGAPTAGAERNSRVVYDGRTTKSFQPPGPVPHAQGFVSKNRLGFEEPNFWPLLLYFRWFGDMSLPKPISCRPDSLTERAPQKVGDVTCRVVRHTGKADPSFTDLYLDPTHGYRVVQLEHWSNGALAISASIEYGTRDGREQPVHWIVRQFRRGIGLAAETATDVTELTVRERPRDGEFEYSFPPGTRVVNSETSEVYIVKEGERKRPISDAELVQRLSNEEIIRSDNRRGGHIRWAIAFTAAAVLVGGSILVFRRMSRRRATVNPVTPPSERGHDTHQ